MTSPTSLRSELRMFGMLATTSTWLVTGTLLGAPETPPPQLPDPAEVAEPTPTPEPLPSVNDGSNNPATPENDNSTEPVQPSLFQNAPMTDQPKPIDASAAQAQDVQALAQALSRVTFARAETNAESLFSGIGGVPQALNPLYSAPGASMAQGFRLGPFLVRPILSVGPGYGRVTGNGERTSGFYGTVSPAFTLMLGEPATGRTLNVDYTGSLIFGSSTEGGEPIEQTFISNGMLNFQKLDLGFGLDVSQLSGSDRDAGGANVDREIIGLTLTASYIYSEKTNFSTSLSTPIRLFDQGDSSEGVNSTNFVNYAYSPLTSVGIGFGLGTLEVEQGQTQLFEEALSQFTYAVSTKFTLNGTLGYEFLDAGNKEEITPIFELGLALNVREGTSLSLRAERRIENSAAEAGTNYTDTSVSVTFSQRLGDIFQFTGTAGYENASYTGVERGVSSSRDDNQLNLQGALSATVRQHWTLTGIFSYAKDSSNRTSFESLQTSLLLSYAF